MGINKAIPGTHRLLTENRNTQRLAIFLQTIGQEASGGAKIMQVVSTAIDNATELEGKTLLLKVSHALITKINNSSCN